MKYSIYWPQYFYSYPIRMEAYSKVVKNIIVESLRFTLAVGETPNSGKIKLLYPKNLNSEFQIFVGANMLSILLITE